MNKTSQKVIVLGSLNMDMVVSLKRQPFRGETMLGSNPEYFPGGKGLNQATAAARDGAKTLMIGAVGDDDFGNQLAQHLKSEGVDISQIRKDHSHPSGLAVINLFEDTGDNSIVVISGANMEISPSVAKDIEISSGDVVLSQLETPQEATAELFQQAKTSGASTCLNPAPWAELMPELTENTDYLIVNETELGFTGSADLGGLESTDSGKTSPKDMRETESSAYAILKKYPKLTGIVCTLGSRGAFGATSEEKLHVQPPPVEAVDPTGAGDCFSGVFGSSLCRGDSFEAACRRAVVAASLSVRKKGAGTSMPAKAETDRALDEVPDKAL